MTNKELAEALIIRCAGFAAPFRGIIQEAARRLLQMVPGEETQIGEIQESKSLRWLANMWPLVEDPKDESDKWSTTIHLYCTAAADRMDQMAEAIEYARKIKQERDAAVADIESARPCFACKNFRRNNGNCGGGMRCVSEALRCENDGKEYNGPEWEWRGANHG